MCTVVERRSARMRPETQKQHSGNLYSRFADQPTGPCMLVMHPMTVQPGVTTSKTEHIMSRYRPIAPKPVAGGTMITPDQTTTTTTDTHNSISTLSAKSASTGNKRKRPPGGFTNKLPSAGKKPRKPSNSGIRESMPSSNPLNLPHSSAGYNLTPLFPVRVAQKFGPGGLQRFHDSFDHRSVPVSSFSLKTKPPRQDVSLGLTIGDGDATEDVEFTDRAASVKKNSSRLLGPRDGDTTEDVGSMDRAAMAENEICSRLLRPRDSRFLLGECGSLSNSFGTDSEVCSAEEFNPNVSREIVTLCLLPDTPSKANNKNGSSSSTLSLLRWDPGASATTDGELNPNLNTRLTMSSTGGWSADTEETTTATPVGMFWERTADASDAAAAAVASAGDPMQTVVVDAHELEERHGGSSEAVMVTDAVDHVLWANSAFKRLTNERMSSRMQVENPKFIHPCTIVSNHLVLSSPCLR